MMLRTVPRPAIGRAEVGFTLVELSVVIAVTLVALLPFSAYILDIMKNEASSIGHGTVTSSVRIALVALQNDLQEANPLTSVPTSGSTSSSVAMKLGAAGGSQQTVTWAVSGGVLTRQVGSSAAVAELNGVTSAMPFTYYSPNGPFQTGEVASCASRIGVALVASRGSSSSPSPFSDQMDVELDNVQPGSLASCH